MQLTPGIAYLSIGVADMNVVETFWCRELGLEILDRRIGPDPELASLWQLPAGQIRSQLLLATPGSGGGRLHFVEFRDPGPPVRAGARAIDLCAKNIDINCVDISARVAMLQRSGHAFRSAPVEYEVDELRAREAQLPVHDGLNAVFIEVLSPAQNIPYTALGFAALTSFVVIVPDTRVEARFYETVFGLTELMHHRLTGPAIEQAVGLPAGSALDMRLLGHSDNVFGRVELIEYQGLRGDDLFARAEPPATGILRCGFHVSSLDAVSRRAKAAGISPGAPVEANLITGAGVTVSLRSPAGLQIEVGQLHGPLR